MELTNNPNIVVSVEDAGLIGKSDHNMILDELNCTPMKKENLQEIPNLLKADYRGINNSLRKYLLRVIFLKYNTEEAWGLLKTRLEDSVVLHVLKIRRRVNNKPIWLDKKTQATVRRKSRLYKRLKETIPQQQKKTRRNRRNKQFNPYIRIKAKYRSTIGPLLDR